MALGPVVWKLPLNAAGKDIRRLRSMLIDLEEYRNRRRARAALVQPLRMAAGGAIVALPAQAVHVRTNAAASLAAIAGYAGIAMPAAAELVEILAEASLI